MKIFKFIDKVFETRLFLFFKEIKADFYFRNFNFEKALELYSVLLDNIPENKEKYFLRISVCHRNEGDLEQALKSINFLNNVEKFEIILEKARIFTAMDNINAVSLFEKTLSLKNDHALLKEVAYACLKFGRIHKAQKYFMDYFKIHPMESPVILEIAKICFYLKDLEKSEEFMEIYKNTGKYSKKNYFEYMALIEETKGNSNLAIEYFNELILIDEKSELAFEHLSILYENTNKIDDLVSLYEKREKIDNENFNIKKKLGIYLMQKGELSKAKYYFEVLIENNLLDRDFITKYVELCINFKDYIKAENICIRLIDSGVFNREEISPFLIDIYFKTGKISLLLKYYNYVEKSRFSTDFNQRFKNVDRDILYTVVLKNSDVVDAFHKCEYVLLDKICTDKNEIINNFFKDKLERIIIYYDKGKGFILPEIENCQLKFNLYEILKNIPVVIREPESATDVDECISSIIEYFRKNQKVFHAYLHMADDEKKDFFLFIRKFINLKITSFSIEDFLNEINVQNTGKEKKKNFDKGYIENEEILKNKNIWIDDYSISGFDKYFRSLLDNCNNKFNVIVSDREKYITLKKYFNEYEEFSFFEGNYICLNRLVNLFKLKGDSIKEVIFWLSKTNSGCMDEVKLSQESKHYLKAGDRNCIQLECPFYEKCFFQNIKKEIFTSRFVLSTEKNSIYFLDKIESSIYMIDPALVNEILKKQYLSLSEISRVMKSMEIYFEINLKNNSNAFKFYKELKENIIRIDRLSTRIIGNFSKSNEKTGVDKHTIINIVPEFDTYMNRLLNYVENMKEKLYDVENFLNTQKFHIVELNYYKNIIGKFQEKIKNINSQSDVWIELETNDVVFYQSHFNGLNYFSKKIFFNMYKNISDSFSTLKTIFNIDSFLIEHDLKENSLKDFIKDNYFISILKTLGNKNFRPYVDYIGHNYKNIEQNNPENSILFSIIESSENKEFFKTLYKDKKIYIDYQDFVKYIMEFSLSGKKINVIYDEEDISDIKRVLDLKKIVYCDLSYDDTHNIYEKKLKGIEKDFYDIIFSERKELLKTNDISIIFSFKEYIVDNKFNIICDKTEEKGNSYYERYNILLPFIRKMIKRNKYENISLSELSYLFFTEENSYFRKFVKEFFSSRIGFSISPEINILNMDMKYKKVLYDNFHTYTKNNKLILRDFKKYDNSLFEILYYLFINGYKSNISCKMLLNKEISSAHDIIYNSLYDVIELLEYFNSFDEIRVFGKKSFDINEFDLSNQVFYWLFFMDFNKLLKVEINKNQIEIVCIEKVEKIIMNLKKEFLYMDNLLKVLTGIFGVDINAYTDVNIFQLYAEVSNNSFDKVKQYIYAMNYMDILKSEPVEIYFSQRLKL